MHFKTTFAAVAALALTATTALAESHSTCAPSKWGAEDTIGAANHVSAERTLEAAFLAALAEPASGPAEPAGRCEA